MGGESSIVDWNQYHFVLVPGAGHGGWCWYKLRTILEASGHKVTCVDLTSSGIDPTHFADVLSFDHFNKPLVDLMSSLPDTQKVVLVGHSFGGLNITDVLYKFPQKIGVAVYLAAIMLKEGNATEMPSHNIHVSAFLKQLFGDSTDSSIWNMVYERNKIGVIMKPEYQRSHLYNMSPVEDSTIASMLLRPMPVEPLQNVPLEPTEGGKSVPRVFIRTLNDALMSQSQSDMMINLWPPAKVYATGSDHSTFLSTPVELSRILIEAATSLTKKN